MGSHSLRLNDPAKPMNVVSPEWIEELIEAIERVAADPTIKGAVITSSKSAFMAGADLKYIYTLTGGAITAHQAFEFSQTPIDSHASAFGDLRQALRGGNQRLGAGGRLRIGPGLSLSGHCR